MFWFVFFLFFFFLYVIAKRCFWVGFIIVSHSGAAQRCVVKEEPDMALSRETRTGGTMTL